MVKDFSFDVVGDPAEEKPRVLIVDDEEVVCSLLKDVLGEKYQCIATNSASDALKLLEESEFDLLICDIGLEGVSGIEIAKEAKSKFPELVIVIISGKGDIESAIEAIRVGAFDYIKKPFDLESVESVAERAMKHRRLLVGKRLYEERLKKLLEDRMRQLDYLSYYDPITNLPNKFLFEDRLTQLIAQAEYSESNKMIAVILISFDQMKRIYSTWGARFADIVLREAALRIRACVGAESTVARMESDELAIFLPRIEGEQDAVEVIQRIKDALKLPITVENEAILVTVSAGISVFPKDCKNAQEAIKNASAALNRAKESKQETWFFFTEELNEKLLRRLEMEMGLRRAIETGELELYFQPKVDIPTAKIIGAEALLRWNHHESGMIMPSDFIPLAEETGLIIPIGDWVLKNAFHQCKIWADKGYNLTVSVNLSPQQLREKGFVEKVEKMIRETGVNPMFLELEITETILIKEPEKSAEVLNKLRKLGIKILIDDFGTGYSSLAYLKKLPIDGLKIDKSFIQDISSAAFTSSAELVMAIVNLAHNLRLKVVAEGVETENQLKFLRFIRCDEAQGYLFGKPVLPGMFANFSI
ncbi:MAG: hypothetical protein KatS3mg006_0556 [Pyrinomonadaceae bacterium]|jgi:diguanylate cyclase (GGDEF)-like protein|nr:MAG: hypothetical protein KatS3mg006_0556 [Pyrinomonadaceae bacterium]